MGKIKQVLLIVAGLLLSLNLLHATPAGLLTLITAVEQTEPTPADELPLVGTFYSAQNPNQPPFPGNINNLPAWNLGNGLWLSDDADFDYSAAHSLRRMGRSMGMDDEGVVP